MQKIHFFTLILSTLCLLVTSNFRPIPGAQPQVYQTLNGLPPLVIGHRGASGLRPAHTLASYILAIEHGADIIEPDLVMTKDGVLICRHEPMLSGSTDVANLPEFADRRTWKNVSGDSYYDWFASDFTLEEIKKLGAIQQIKARSQEYNSMFSIATFDEVVELAKAKSAELGRTISVYPEIKHPIFHETNGLAITDVFLAALDRLGWNHYDSPVYVQSLESVTLQYIRSKSTVKIVQLILGSGINKKGEVTLRGFAVKPYNFVTANDTRTFQDLVTDAGLDFISSYANGIGVWIPYVLPYTYQDLDGDNKPDDINGDGRIDNRDFKRLPCTDLVDRAHQRDMIVHVYTLKNEPSMLLSDYQGDPRKEYEALFELGVDGVFSDFPGTAVEVRDGGQGGNGYF